MDVEGSDQRERPSSGRARHELRDRPPGPEPSTTMRVTVPTAWPEVWAFRAGYRLAEEEEDTVPTLIRLGSDITGYLWPEEVGAMLELGLKAWERWLLLGWRAWQSEREGG